VAQAGHARKALDLARDRYNTGVAQFITVLDAERTLFEAQQQAASSATNVAVDLVALYKALGGGWEDSFPANPGSVATLDPSR
jgi:outer membrane protein TolC